MIVVREAAQKSAPRDKALHKALGVGRRVDIDTVKTVEAGLKSIIKTAEDQGDAVRAIGILSDEVDAAKLLLASLTTADQVQEKSKLTSTEATALRDTLRLGVENAVGKIQAAAVLAFRKQPDVAKKFRDLTPGSGGAAGRDGDGTGSGGTTNKPA